MKNIFTSVICIAVSVLANAQPAILSTTMMSPGTSITMKTAISMSAIDTTIQGANKIWDFTALQADPSKDDFIVTVLNAANTPYASSFPASNFCYKEVSGITTYYSYFTLNSTTCERIGRGSPSSSTTIVKYSDTQIEYAFPLTMGTKSTDTWANDQSSFGGTYGFEGIGYGTLKLPGKTYSNVLMVRADVYEISHVPVYFWYNTNGTVLVQYIKGDGFFYPRIARYASSILNQGVKEELNEVAISYINPVENRFELSFNQPVLTSMQYAVLNVLGETVKGGSISSSVKSLQIDISELNSGIYYFVANGQNEAIKPIKFLKTN